METLQQMLVALVKEAPGEALDGIQQELSQGTSNPTPSPEIPGYLLQPFLRAWHAVGIDRVPPQALAMALGATRAMKQRVEADAPRLNLVWTGPHSPAHIHTRTTASALREMIESARHRILVVTYDLTRNNDLSAGVIDALARARGKGRKVTMALHDDGTNFGYVMAMWPRELPLPRLLCWVGSPESPYAKLHAKLVMVDGEDLLITSANLTLHGLEHNIELGVRIRGKFAREVDRHFGNLEAEGFLAPYKGAPR